MLSRTKTLIWFGLILLLATLEYFSILYVSSFFAEVEQKMNTELAIITLAVILSVMLTKIWLQYTTTSLAFSTGAKLDVELLWKFIRSDYETTKDIHENEILSSISTQHNQVIAQLFIPVLQLASGVFIVFAIAVALLKSIGASVLLIIPAVTVMYLTPTLMLLKSNSNVGRLIASTQNSLVGYTERLLKAKAQLYWTTENCPEEMHFIKTTKELRRLQRFNQLSTTVPKIVIDGCILLGAVTILWMLSSSSREGQLFQFLGTFAFAAQRIIPTAQHISRGWIKIKGYSATLHATIDRLSVMDTSEARNHIRLSVLPTQLKYQHSKDLTLYYELPPAPLHRSKILLKGRSGVGKTTLVEMLVGLRNSSNEPKQSILWDRVIYIPQDPILLDQQIVGLWKYFKSKAELIERYSSHEAFKFFTEIDSEALIPKFDHLSGGQKQRLILLYTLCQETTADLYVFDELTSGLPDALASSLVELTCESLRDSCVIFISHQNIVCDALIEVTLN